MASSFLSRWTGKGDHDAGGPDGLPSPPGELLRPQPGEGQPPGKRHTPSAVAWSAPPSLEKLAREFEAQLRAIEEARRYLADRLAPFQRHLAAQRRNVDQALKQLEARVRPLRQYLEGQEQNLSRVGQHLNAELKDQFDAFGRYLQEQERILEMATRYLDDQPRPLQRYGEDQARIVELIYKEIEERLEPFARFLKDQLRILEAIATPQILEEFELMAGYMQERERALERFAASAAHRPGELFAELDEIQTKYTAKQTGAFRILLKVLEQSRLADERLRETLRPARDVLEALPADAPEPAR